MTRGYALIALLVVALAMPALAAAPHDDLGIPDIMAPESPLKGKAVHKRKIPRGSSSPVYPTPLPPPLHYNPPPTQEFVNHPPAVPPPMLVPETGRVLPNLPAVSGSGPRGTETFQDRATRCVHQSGVYGPTAAGNPNAYVGGCVNQ